VLSKPRPDTGDYHEGKLPGWRQRGWSPDQATTPGKTWAGAQALCYRCLTGRWKTLLDGDDGMW